MPPDEPASGSRSREARESMARQSRRGARLGIAVAALTQVGSIVATVFLARLLSPAEFGIIALTQSLLGFAQLLSISGVRAALVTRRSEVSLASDTYFWASAAMACVVWGGVTLLAPWVTGLLHQPDAAPYLVVLTGAFAMDLVAIIPMARLQRDLRFSSFYAAVLAGTLTYFVSQVGLAFAGFGAWSVVIGRVLDSAVALVLALCFARWLPRLRFGRRLLRQDAALTGGVTLNSSLVYVQRNVDYWVVSATLGGVALGTYYVAYVLPDLVRQRMAAISGPVLLPAYVRASDDKVKLSQAWQRSWLIQMFVGLPALCGIACLASPIVAVVFGPQWALAVTPMQILTIVTIADLHMGTVSIMAVARRRVWWNTRVGVVRAVSTLILTLAAAATVGTIVSVSIAVAVSAVIALAFQEATLSRNLGIGMRPILRPMATYIGLSIVMGSVVSGFLILAADWGSLPQMIVGVALGAGTYLGLGVLAFPRQVRPPLRDIRLIGLGR